MPATADDLDERAMPLVRFCVGDGVAFNFLLVACFVRLDRRLVLFSPSSVGGGNDDCGVARFISFVVTIVLNFVAVRPPFVSTMIFFLLVCINRG